MKIKTVNVIRPLDLGEYTEALRGQTLSVWVNPPREVRQARTDLLRDFGRLVRGVSVETKLAAKKKLLARGLALFKKPLHEVADVQQKLYEWLSAILSQDVEACTAEDLAELAKTDQVLFEWIVKRVVEMIEAWRAEKKSPLKPQSGN